MEQETIHEQLTLPFNHTDHSLRHYLEECLSRPISLVLTENSTSMLSARTKSGMLCIRLHRMFLKADSAVMHEIVSYLKNRGSAMPYFRGFIRSNRALLSRTQQKKVPVRTAGRVYDLCELYDEVNKEYFGGAINAVITWGSASPRQAARKRTVGSYSERSNTIRINPLLDRKNVPRCYVAFIVYHEMLHAAMGMPLRGTRRSVHSREFRRREKLFQDYEKAREWEGGKT